MLPSHLGYGPPPRPRPVRSAPVQPRQSTRAAPQQEHSTLSKAPPGPPPGNFQFGRHPPGQFGCQPPGDFQGPPVGAGRHIYGATFRPPPPPPMPSPSGTASHFQSPRGAVPPHAEGPEQPAASAPRGRSGLPADNAIKPEAGQTRKSRRRRQSPKPFQGGQHVSSSSWRDAQAPPQSPGPATLPLQPASSRPPSSHALQEHAPNAGPQQIKAEQASSRPPSRSKADQAFSDKGNRPRHPKVEADQAKGAPRSRVPHSSSSRRQLSPAQRDFLRGQLSPAPAEPNAPHTEGRAPPAVQAKEARDSPDTRRRLKADRSQPAASYSARRHHAQAEQADHKPSRRRASTHLPDSHSDLPAQGHATIDRPEGPHAKLEQSKPVTPNLRPKRGRAKPPPATDSQSSASPQSASQRSRSPAPTKFEAELAQWEQRRHLEEAVQEASQAVKEESEASGAAPPAAASAPSGRADWERRRLQLEEVGRAEALAVRRRAVDPGLRQGEARSHCLQRVSPRRPRTRRDEPR